MRHFFFRTAILCFVLQVSPAIVAEVGWVDDKLYVPMRTGPSSRHSITHRGLVSGTRLEILSSDEESGFTHVRLRDGKEGYLPSQYVSKIPIAEDRLAEANKTIEALTSKSKPLQQQLFELRENNKSLEQQVSTLTGDKKRLEDQLSEIQQISKSHIETAQKNKALLKENESHKNTIDVLKADNTRLKQRSDQEWFINGAGAVVLGVILTLVIPRLVPKKRGTEWA